MERNCIFFLWMVKVMKELKFESEINLNDLPNKEEFIMNICTAFRYENERLNALVKIKDDSIQNLIKEKSKLLADTIELNNIIKEAIEYIEEHIKYECDNVFDGMQFYSYNLYGFKKDVLLEILRGEQNDKIRNWNTLL